MRALAGLLFISSLANTALASELIEHPLATAAPAKASSAKLVSADKAQLSRIEHYLESIQTISASFIQVSPDGSLANGKFYLQRPGKLRMEYAPPVPVLVVTNHGNIVYYDSELDQITNVSLDSTLVGFLARDKIRFDDKVTVTHFERAAQRISISLVQAERANDGAMTLEFSDNPLMLRNIIITDSSGQSTTVSLANARVNEKLPADLFIFKDPHPTGKRHIQK